MKTLSAAIVLVLALTLSHCGNFLEPDPGPPSMKVTVVDNWELAQTPYPFVINPRALHFPSTTVGFVVGVNGEIFKTADAGSSWKKMNSGTTLPLFSVMMLNDEVGFTAGHAQSCSDADCNKGSVLLKTSNGGETWSKTFYKDYSRIDRLHFFDESNGLSIIHTVEPVNSRSYHLARTTDGGANWQLLDLKIKSEEKFHVTGGVVYVAGEQARVFKSKDKGASWETINTPSEAQGLLTDVYFFNENIGFVNCSPQFYRTTDGGSTWQQIAPGFSSFGIFHMYDAQEGINVEAVFSFQGGATPVFQGTSVYHTTNGGQTWKKSETSASLFVAWASFPDQSTGLGSNYAEFVTIRRVKAPG